MERLFVFGASGHAKVVLDIVERAGVYGVAGVLADHDAPGSQFFGYDVLGAIDAVGELGSRLGVGLGIIAIGDNWTRGLVVERIRAAAPGFRFVSAVHPFAHVGRGAHVGDGSVVMPGAVLGADAAVGEHCIVNTGATLDHDCVLGSFASLAPQAAVGGNVALGAYSAVGIGACVNHGLRIGAHSVVGSGAVVVRDVPDNAVSLGCPARTVRTREPGEAYL